MLTEGVCGDTVDVYSIGAATVGLPPMRVFSTWMTKRAKLTFAAFGAAVVVVVALGFVTLRRRWNAPLPSIDEATKVIRVVEHGPAALVARQVVVRNPARVRALLEAASVGALVTSSCSDDYTGSDIDLVLMGSDAYARRTLHVYRIRAGDAEDAGDGAEVVLSSATGCARASLARPEAFRTELARAFDGRVERR